MRTSVPGIACLLLLLNACSNKERVFSILDNKKIGIQFENTLNYTEEVNAYLFRSFYNGAGVALSDLNNDGNLDLFLCGNQVSNKVYLGDGKFNFTDITKSSGLESLGAWTTGVSIVDINEDGWKDIYVCKSGPLNTANRRNQLFINKGIDSNGQLKFIDSAAEYGIDDWGFSIHAVFFDYDRDGDLDMYLSNNSQRPSDMMVTANRGMREQTGGGSKLYKNVGNRFVDATKEVGIYNSPIGFGLGIAAGDINRDGWVDLYVANDFFEKDYLYINQHNGTFKESISDLTKEISLGSMGVDISDMNHDGYPEIFVTEMLPESEDRLKTKVNFDNWDQYMNRVDNGYHRQFPRNTFQLNRGSNGKDSSVYFSEISRYANVAATDWSWGVQMADFDNDGQKEIFVTNGIGKDLLDRDFLSYYDNPEKLREILRTKGKVMTELFDQMPSKPISNYLLKTDSNLVFSNVSDKFGVDQPGFSSGSAYGDIDNDGDLDLVVNNVNGPPFIYRNNSTKAENHFISMKVENSKGITAVGAQVSVWAGGKLFFEELFPMRGSMSVCDDRLLIGIGKSKFIDSILIQWPTGDIKRLGHIPADSFMIVREDPNKLYNTENKSSGGKHLFTQLSAAGLGVDFCHKESKFADFDKDNLLFQMYSNEGPKIAIGDVNGDGLDDFFIGGAKGQQGAVYRQSADGFIRTNLTNSVTGEAEQQCAVFFDADNDGDKDLIVASGSYEFPAGVFALTDRLYINDGKGNFTISQQILPARSPSSTSVIAAADFDGDGDTDLFFGGRLIQDSYGLPASSYLMVNDGKGQFTDVTAKMAPGLKNLGMVTDAVWSDIDKDGDLDLVVVGEWMPIKIFENNHGVFRESDKSDLSKTNGFWNTIAKADLDGDGDDDYIIGNSGYNSFLKPSYDQPAEMYIKDFDHNGIVDQVIATYKRGKAYPLAMKDVLTKQLPYLQKRYLKFSSYAGQTIEDIFSKDELKDAIVLNAYETGTSILWNDKGRLNLQTLPFEAQLAPVYAIFVSDVNADGRMDIIMGGNQYNGKPQTGIYAGSYGTVVLNRENRVFEALSLKNSGFFLDGQIRDIKKLKFNNSDLLFTARNNDSLSVFKINSK